MRSFFPIHVLGVPPWYLVGINIYRSLIAKKKYFLTKNIFSKNDFPDHFRWFRGKSSKSSEMLGKIARVKMFFGDFSSKKCFSSKIFFRLSGSYICLCMPNIMMVLQKLVGRKNAENLAFVFIDFTDFACFGHGLDRFLKGQW